MRVIKKEVGKAARWVDIENSLESLQREVGGYIEAVTLTSDCALIVNEEGRLIGLPYNCTISNLDLVGPVLVVGINGEELADCPLSAMRVLFGGAKSETK